MEYESARISSEKEIGCSCVPFLQRGRFPRGMGYKLLQNIPESRGYNDQDSNTRQKGQDKDAFIRHIYIKEWRKF